MSQSTPNPPLLYPWPSGKKAAISITLDNMGEAADLHRGLWPPTTPVGTHFSVVRVLPKILSLLSDLELPATYFIEAWNCGVYGPAIKGVCDAGHEVAFHAHQHEVWSLLSADAEVANLDASVALAARVGVRYRGFRPPGGKVTERTLGLMRDCYGMRYLSPAAAKCAVVEGVAIVPFQWEGIDAYFYLEAMAPVRVQRGDGEETVGAQEMKRRLIARIDHVVEQGGYLSLLFHPFLQTTEERLSVMREVLEYVKEQREKHGIWVAKCEDVAEWILEHESAFGDDPEWDTSGWKKN